MPLHAARLDLADDWQHVRRESSRRRSVYIRTLRAGVGEVGPIAQPGPLRLALRQGGAFQAWEAARLFDSFVRGPRTVTEWAATIERAARPDLYRDRRRPDDVTTRRPASGAGAMHDLGAARYLWPPADRLPPIERGDAPRVATRTTPSGSQGSARPTTHLGGLGRSAARRRRVATLGLPADGERFLCCQNVTKYLKAHDDVFRGSLCGRCAGGR